MRWNASRGPTLGIEWELQLIDAASRQLRQDAREIIAAMPGSGGNGGHPRIHYELMRSTVEVVTGVCSTVPEAKADLAVTIAELQRRAASRGILLACSGTHPVSDWRNAKVAPVQRYAELAERMQWLARRLQTFSVQVHVGLQDGIRPRPDFGTVEIRIFDGVPTAREVGMVAALSQCLIRFFEMRMDRGDRLPSPPSWVVQDNRWRAIRYGLDAAVITNGSGATAPLRDELHELVNELEPVAERLGCLTELRVVSEVLGCGASYERQRAVLAHTGDMTRVVDALITEFAEDRFVIPEEGVHGRG
jgi:gamma-glutamyl:cysteine ligase YbdK (ATP-grasp superfamily)